MRVRAQGFSLWQITIPMPSSFDTYLFDFRDKSVLKVLRFRYFHPFFLLWPLKRRFMLDWFLQVLLIAQYMDRTFCWRYALSTKCIVDEVSCRRNAYRRSVVSTKCLSTKFFRQNILSTNCFVDEMLFYKKTFYKTFSTKWIRRSACRQTCLSTNDIAFI